MYYGEGLKYFESVQFDRMLFDLSFVKITVVVLQ